MIYLIEFEYTGKKYTKIGFSNSKPYDRVRVLTSRLRTHYGITTSQHRVLDVLGDSEGVEHLILGVLRDTRDYITFSKVSTEILALGIDSVLKELSLQNVAYIDYLEDKQKEERYTEDVGINRRTTVGAMTLEQAIVLLDEVAVLRNGEGELLLLSLGNLSETCRHYGWSKPQVHRVVVGQEKYTHGYYLYSGPIELILSRVQLPGYKIFPTKLVEGRLEENNQYIFASKVSNLARHLGIPASSLSGAGTFERYLPKYQLTTRPSVTLYYRLSE